MMNLRQFKNLMQKLREHIGSDQVDSRTRGLLSNVLGELKELESGTKVEAQSVKYEFTKIVELWKTDPVIQAYLQQKLEMQEEISRLSAMANDPWDD
jgi:predicted lipase